MAVKSIAPVGDWLDEARRLTAERGLHTLPEVVLGVAIRRLGAVGGALWAGTSQNGLSVVAQQGVGAERIDHLHQRWPGHAALLEQVRGSGQPQTVSARLDRSIAGGSSDNGPSVPLALLVAPFRRHDAGDRDVIELFVAGRMEGDSAHEALRALDQFCQGAAQLDVAPAPAPCVAGAAAAVRPVLDRRPNPVGDAQFSDFCTALHGSLDVDVTATAIANHVRAWLGCDRASVVRRRGRRGRLLAVSDVDQPDRRSEAVKSIEALATQAIREGRPVWSDPAARASHALPDGASGAWGAAAVPLSRGASAARRPTGVLVVEDFRTTTAWPQEFRDRVELAAAQSALALENAIRYETVPFSRVGRWLQRLGWRSVGARFVKWTVALALLAAIAAALTLVETNFDITGGGTLLPANQRDVFARINGVVDELLVEHGAIVAAGDPLLRLQSHELQQRRAELEGERRTTEQQISDLAALRGGRDSRSEARPLSQAELAARQAELTAVLEGLDQQLTALARHEAELTVSSPISGRVLTSDVEQLLEGRPVLAEQRLLTVADVDGPWIVEVRVPDRDICHVHDALASGAPLPVTFLAATDLESRRSGTVQDVAGVVEHDPLDGAVVVVTVAVAPDQELERRPGATVYPRIHCGRRSLGYVWFRRAYESAAAWLALW